MKKLVLLFAAAALCVTPAFAQLRTHLEPEQTDPVTKLPTSYGEWRSDYPRLFDAHVITRLIIESGFVGVSAVGLREHAGRYSIITYERSAGSGNKLACETWLDATRAERALAAWRKVLAAIAPHEEPANTPGVETIQLDGLYLHFSMSDGKAPSLFGVVWSPYEGSDPDNLFAIAMQLSGVCRARNDAQRADDLRELDKALDSLVQEQNR